MRIQATEATLERANNPQSDTILVYVAAQHPLDYRILPGREFIQRLERALQLYDYYTYQADAAQKVEFVISASRHHEDGHTDKAALYDAGCLYLFENGIPIDLLHGKDWADKYAPEGVYSGADEMAVATAAFLDNEQFSQLICVVSPGQIKRAQMYAEAMGVIPSYTTHDALKNSANLYHSHRSAKRRTVELIAHRFEPDGQGLLHHLLIRRGRVPSDRNTGSIADEEHRFWQMPGH